MRPIWIVLAAILIPMDAYSGETEAQLNVQVFENLRIVYQLPKAAQIIIPPRDGLYFPKKRPFPLGWTIVQAGLGRPRDEIYPAIMALCIWKLSQNYFDRDFHLEDLHDVLVKEKVVHLSHSPFAFRYLFDDDKRQRWLVYASHNQGKTLIHTYYAPLTDNTVLEIGVYTTKEYTSSEEIAEAQLALKEVIDSAVIEQSGN